MKNAFNMGFALAVFAVYSALGYVIMAGGLPGAFWSGFSGRVREMSAPAVGLIGPGITGGAVIVLGSILAGYILFGKAGVEDEQT